MAPSKAFTLALTFSAALLAQNAQITGRVTDSLQAVVVGAEVTATNADTQVPRRTVTNEQGLYSIPGLAPGPYNLSIAKSGFRTETRNGLRLIVDQTATLDFQLQVGGVTESIEVSAQAALLDAQTSSLGQIIDNTKIQNIPLNGRSAFRLVQLTPGVLTTTAAFGQFGDIPVNTTWDTNFSINGGRAQSNEVQIDGVPATAGFFNQITTIPSIESTQEFKVQSNNLSAEWGRFGGGVLNVSTRSGTNEFHGSVFEFLRNSAFDANEFFNKRSGRDIPPFRMNQFGGALGGPVVKNKTFFFGDYQGTRYRRGDVFRTSLPTALERAGDFSQTFAANGALVTIYDPLSSSTARLPFAGNRLPSNRVSPIAQKLIAYYPQPNVQGDPFTNFNNFISNAGRAIDSDQFSVKVDHNFSETWRTFGRFARNKTTLAQPDYFNNVATSGTGAVGTTPFTQHTAALDNTFVLSPTTLLSVRYGFARWYQLRQTRSYGFDQREVGLPASLVSQFQVPVFPHHQRRTVCRPRRPKRARQRQRHAQPACLGDQDHRTPQSEMGRRCAPEAHQLLQSRQRRRRLQLHPRLHARPQSERVHQHGQRRGQPPVGHSRFRQRALHRRHGHAELLLRLLPAGRHPVDEQAHHEHRSAL
ncbi:MAG: TonB-dependent receptor [Bryobacterales bacterium]|nr:TonB-dependent receptor [Bryobacterales bacterium]